MALALHGSLALVFSMLLFSQANALPPEPESKMELMANLEYMLEDYAREHEESRGMEPKEKNPCEPNPCANGGQCRTSEDPFRWGYYCHCPAPSGGRTCQFSDPCNKERPCPPEHPKCFRSFISETGRYCYA